MSSSPPPPPPPQKGHSRTTSEDRRVNLPRRRTTKGPLDLDEYRPLRPPSPTSNPPLTPPLTPPRPKTLMNLSPLPPTPQSPPPVTTGAIPMPLAPAKDLSFLLIPTLFTSLPTTSHPPLPPPPPSATPAQLLTSLHFRAAAIAAATALTSQPPPQPAEIFTLWHIRLTALSLLNSPAAEREVKAFNDLSSAFYRDPASGAHIIPWDLRVLAIRLQAGAGGAGGGGGGDWRRGVGAYYELAREARQAALDAALSLEERKQWRARLRELGIRVAGCCVELGDLDCAIRALDGLASGVNGAEEEGGEGEEELEQIRGMQELVMARAGIVEGVREGPLRDMVQGEWASAAEGWHAQAKKKQEDNGEVAEMERCNEAVCLLYLGKLKEARETLEKLVDEGQSFPGLVFNLATIYELCGEGSRKLKVELAEKVARMGGREMMSSSYKM